MAAGPRHSALASKADVASGKRARSTNGRLGANSMLRDVLYHIHYTHHIHYASTSFVNCNVC